MCVQISLIYFVFIYHFGFFFFLLCFNPAYCFLCLIFLFVSLFLSHFDVYMSHHLLILSALIFLTFVILLFWKVSLFHDCIYIYCNFQVRSEINRLRLFACIFPRCCIIFCLFWFVSFLLEHIIWWNTRIKAIQWHPNSWKHDTNSTRYR